MSGLDRGVLLAVLLGAQCGATSTVDAKELVGQAEAPPDPVLSLGVSELCLPRR